MHKRGKLVVIILVFILLICVVLAIALTLREREFEFPIDNGQTTGEIPEESTELVPEMNIKETLPIKEDNFASEEQVLNGIDSIEDTETIQPTTSNTVDPTQSVIDNGKTDVIVPDETNAPTEELPEWQPSEEVISPPTEEETSPVQAPSGGGNNAEWGNAGDED